MMMGGFGSQAQSARSRGPPPSALRSESMGPGAPPGAPPGGFTFGSAATKGFGAQADGFSFGATVSDCAPGSMAPQRTSMKGPANLKSQSLSHFSPVLGVSSCQAANGSFPPSPVLASLIGSTQQDLKTINWSTAFTVAWLMERKASDEDEWRLVVDKALKWLSGEGGDSLVEIARGILKGTFCPSGHPLQAAQRQPGELWHCDRNGGCLGSCKVDSDHIGVESWRCVEDMRMKAGGTCNYDICGGCVFAK